MKKRLVSIVMIIAMMAALLPVAKLGITAYAADGDFTIKNGVLTKYNGSGGDVVIPEGVKSISDFAFGLNSSMTSVTIPKSVTTIGEDTFSTCSGLKSFVVKSGNPSYSSQDGVLYDKDRTTLLICPAKKTGTVSIPDTVTSIGEYAFGLCADLTGIVIPKSLTSIEQTALSGCKSLTSISVDGSNPAYSSEDGVLYNKNQTILLLCPAKKASVSIPNSVITIGKRAFNGCNSLTSIDLPDSVTTICYGAFTECSGLTGVVLPKSVTAIEDYAFFYCTELREITIPDSVTSLGMWMFAQCDKLERIYYPGSRAQWEKLLKGEHGSPVTLHETQDNIRVFYNYWSDSFGILTHPANVKAPAGQSVSFTVKAKGEGLTYQWYYKKEWQSSWNKWGTRNTPTTTATSNATWHNMQVYCKITDKNGYVLHSNPAVFTLSQEIKIIQQPENMDFRWGDRITLSVKAEGIGLTYQWYFRKQGQSSFSKWKGRTHATESVTPNATWDMIQLYCVIEDSVGNKISTNPIVISFIKAIQLTRQPEDVTVRSSEKATFNVQAEGEGLTYQWYFRKSNASGWSVWKGHTTSSTSAVANPTWNGMQVRCIVGNGTGETVTSSAAWITLSDAMTIIQQPVDQTIALGDTINLSVRTLSDNFIYQWYYKKAGQTSFTRWNGRNHATETVTPNATWNGIQLYCEIKDGAGNTVRSDVVQITIK